MMYFLFQRIHWKLGGWGTFSWCINPFEKTLFFLKDVLRVCILPPSLLTKDIICFFLWLLFFLSYKEIYNSSHHVCTSALYCARLFVVFWHRYFRKLGFYSLKLGLKSCMMSVVWSTISSSRVYSSWRFRLALLFEKAIVKARISILIISQYKPFVVDFLVSKFQRNCNIRQQGVQ